MPSPFVNIYAIICSEPNEKYFLNELTFMPSNRLSDMKIFPMPHMESPPMKDSVRRFLFNLILIIFFSNILFSSSDASDASSYVILALIVYRRIIIIVIYF